MKYLVLSLIFLTALASQISAQSILKDGKIPDDLVITIGLIANMQFGGYQTYKITSDGKVFYDEFSNLPPVSPNVFDLIAMGQKNVKKPKLPKPPKLKDKFSRNQLQRIIFAVEKSGFWEIADKDQCEPNYNHYTTKGISITLYGKTRAIEEIKLRCGNDENLRLKNFVNLYDLISKELSGVKKTKLTK